MNMNKEKELFQYKDSFYIIEAIKYETRESHMDRVMYILSGIEKGGVFEDLKKMSLIWSNVKKLGCEYNSTLMDEIIKN